MRSIPRRRRAERLSRRSGRRSPHIESGVAQRVGHDITAEAAVEKETRCRWFRLRSASRRHALRPRSRPTARRNRRRARSLPRRPANGRGRPRPRTPAWSKSGTRSRVRIDHEYMRISVGREAQTCRPALPVEFDASNVSTTSANRVARCGRRLGRWVHRCPSLARSRTEPRLRRRRASETPVVLEPEFGSQSSAQDGSAASARRSCGTLQGRGPRRRR